MSLCFLLMFFMFILLIKCYVFSLQNTSNFCQISHALPRPYVYIFRQIFHVLRLFPALRLFRSPDYYTAFTPSRTAMGVKQKLLLFKVMSKSAQCSHTVIQNLELYFELF